MTYELNKFQAALSQRVMVLTGEPEIIAWQPLGSGVGGERWRVSGRTRHWFIKCAANSGGLFAAEADGLQALGSCDAIRVPEVFECGELEGVDYIIMEWLSLGRTTRDTRAAAQLGSLLARQHRHLGERFGWQRDNFIGATRQVNTQSDNWIDFYREHRLGFQLQLAAQRGYRGELQRQGERLLEKLDGFFTDYSPAPSLLHGDLWSGNWDVLETGEPVIFDPAVYYGDREADIAMTELFGGFPTEFYAAYDERYPRDSGYRVRRDLYNLYHVLNHLNLFGGGYLSQALRLTNTLLAALA